MKASVIIEFYKISLTYFKTVGLTPLAHSVCMTPNFQGLPWSECDGLGNDELLTLFLFNP